MAYVVVVFALLNTAALLAVGWYLRECWRDLPQYVSTAIQDEVRKQDDRIEKRLARAVGQDGDKVENDFSSGYTDVLKPGAPLRRNRQS